jgi:hypothetical protein
VLDSIGDEALPAFGSLAQNTNRLFASQVLARLAQHTNGPAVRQALTNALASTDLIIHKQVQAMLADYLPQ